MNIDLDQLGSSAVAGTPTRTPSLDEVRARSRRNRSRRHVAMAAFGAPVLVVVAALLIGQRNDSSLRVTTAPDASTATAPTTGASAPVAPLDCSVDSADVDATNIVGNEGSASLQELARKVWPALAPELELTAVSAVPNQCRVEVSTVRGEFVLGGVRGGDGLWYLAGVGPLASPESGLQVDWRNGTVRIAAGFDCPDCVSAETLVLAENSRTQDRGGVPVDVRIDAPGADTQRGVLIRYRDATGDIVSVTFVAVPPGDFSAG